MITALKNRTHHHHYWSWIIISWSTAALIEFGAIKLQWETGDTILFISIGMPPFLAHSYALFANLSALRKLEEPHRVGPALTGASYGTGVLCSMYIAPWPEALYIPYVGVFVTMLSIGTLFAGLAPLLAFAVTNYVLNKRLSRLTVCLCLAILTAGWMIASSNISRVF